MFFNLVGGKQNDNTLIIILIVLVVLCLCSCSCSSMAWMINNQTMHTIHVPTHTHTPDQIVK